MTYTLAGPARIASLLVSVLLAASVAPAQVQSPVHTLPAVPTAPPGGGTGAGVGVPVPTGTGGGTDVNVSNMAGNESEVMIDINPLNPQNQVICGHAPGGFLVLDTFYTMDGGSTWNLVQLGDADDGLIGGNLRFDPALAFGDDGNVYVVYGVRQPGPERTTVVVATSSDGGQTYSFTNVATNNNIGVPGNDKWFAATGPDPVVPGQTNVYITWTQNVSEPGGTDQRVVISRSTDGGATFSAPLIVNDASIAGTSGGNLFADPAVGPGGEVYVSYWAVNTGDVFVDVSFDGGLTFGTDSLIVTSSSSFRTSVPPQPDRGIFVGPIIDADRSGGPFNGRLYCSYTDLGPGGLPDVDIFMVHSDDDGATWSAPVRVNDDAGTNTQFLPNLDVDQTNGTVCAIWYDARNDPTNRTVEVFVAASTSGGASFAPSIRISDGQSDQSTANPARWSNNYLEYIGVALHAGELATVWADNSGDPANLDLFTDPSATLNITTVPFAESFDAFGATPMSTAPPAGWLQDLGDGGGGAGNDDWIFNDTATPTSGTGPPADNTTGVPGAGFYAYVEDDGDHSEVNLSTPYFDLRGAVGASLEFFVYSHNADPAPTGPTQNELHLDAVTLPGSGIITDIVPPIGHLGPMWQQQSVDLSAFDGRIVQIRLRVDSNNGANTHDIAVDDFTVLCQPGLGQAPQAGMAVLDINDAIECNGLPVSSGVAGPYRGVAAGGGTLTFSFAGEAGQPLIMLTGTRQIAANTFPPFGQLDLVQATAAVVGNGTQPGLPNRLFALDATGSQSLTFTVPPALVGLDFPFQCIMFNTAMAIAFSNMVDLAIVP